MSSAHGTDSAKDLASRPLTLPCPQVSATLKLPLTFQKGKLIAFPLLVIESVTTHENARQIVQCHKMKNHMIFKNSIRIEINSKPVKQLVHIKDWS